MIKKRKEESNTDYVRRLVEKGVYPNSISGARKMSKSKIKISGYDKEGKEECHL